MFIQRTLTSEIIQKIQKTNKVVVLYGPRQVGKTTLIKNIIEQLGLKTLSVNGDEQKYVDVLSSRDFDKLRNFVAGYKLLFIDEAQKIPNIGINLKILVDQIPELKIIATGSSSFDLADKVSEPLTGRSWTYKLYPIAFLELQQNAKSPEGKNLFELENQLEERLIYGSYPEIFSLKGDEIKHDYLENIRNAYLYKDILELTNIKHSAKIRDLVKLLAFQIGHEVSLNELGRSLDMSKETVESYIDLLEKSFVIFRLSGFSRNLRKEIRKMNKIYFYDLGIRNIIIDNLNPLKDRNDTGQIWENFLVLERTKLLHYKKILASQYFWRTYTGAEIDYVEDRSGSLFGYEFKFNTKEMRAPKTWLESYKNASFETINKENFLKFILEPLK